MAGNVVEISQAEYIAALRFMDKMKKSLPAKWMKSTIRRNCKPILDDMKTGSNSVKLAKMIGATTSVRRAGPTGVRIGVIKNDKALFPKFSAPALASVIENGTKERFRQIKSRGLVTGRISTGSMPSAPFLRPAWYKNAPTMAVKTEKAILKKVPQ